MPAQTANGPHLLHARLDELTGLIRDRQACSDSDNLAIGIHLCEIEDLELWKQGNYSSLTAYARQAHGYHSGRTAELKGTARAYLTHAGFKAAVDERRINYSQAREIAKAPAADYDLLIEKARDLDDLGLRDEVNGRTGRRRYSFLWTEEQRAWVDDAARVFRGGTRKNLPLAEALPEICREYVENPAGKGRSSARVLLYHCPSCRKTTREHAAGSYELSPEAAEAALRDAQVVDLTTGAAGKPPLTRRKKIPQQVRDQTLTPHRHRCAVPGCRNRVVDHHHEDGWENGDDPARCLPLCGAHHRQRHSGHLRILKVFGVWLFFRADGVFLGRAGDREMADPRAHPRLPALLEVLASASGPVPEPVSVPEPVPVPVPVPELASASDPEPVPAGEPELASASGSDPGAMEDLARPSGPGGSRRKSSRARAGRATPRKPGSEARAGPAP